MSLSANTGYFNVVFRGVHIVQAVRLHRGLWGGEASSELGEEWALERDSDCLLKNTTVIAKEILLD